MQKYEIYDGVKLSSVSNCPRCQIVLPAWSVSNCPILHDGVKLSSVSNCPRCQIVLLAWSVSNCPRCQIVLGVKLSHHRNVYLQGGQKNAEHMLYLLLFCTFVLGPGALQRHSYFSARSSNCLGVGPTRSRWVARFTFQEDRERIAHVEKCLILSET